MKKKRRFVNIGDLPTGDLNNICDVPGVLVDIIRLTIRTIIPVYLAILPHEGIYSAKKLKQFPCFQWFCKSVGVMQIEEMGTIETPILLTNTLNVGKVSDGLITYMLQDNKEIGVTTGTINPLVLECNDGRLNKIQERILGEEAVFSAIASAKMTSFKVLVLEVV